MLFICYPKCSTCKKQRLFWTRTKFHIRFAIFNRRIRRWKNCGTGGKSAVSLYAVFNTSGLQYRALDLKNRLPEMTEEEQLALLATDGMLVKRPVLVLENRVFLGFRQEEWAAALLP